MTKNTNLNQQM